MAISVLFGIVDAKNLPSTVEINLPTATTLAAASTFAASFAPLIDAVITGAITRIGLVFSVALPGTIRASALSDSDVEEGASFRFTTVNGNKTGFRLPTFQEAMIASNSRAVDVEDADVAALVAAMISGLAGTTPTDSRNEDIVALRSAKEMFQKSRA